MKTDPYMKRAISRRIFLKKIGKAAFGGVCIGASTFYYSRSLETTWIDITRLSLQLPRLPSAFHNYRSCI
jgi:hypothetical protein